jgi:diacylglycerol kinase (ATP)
MNEPEEPVNKSTPAPKKGIRRLIAATGYSLAGLRAAFASEEAFRIESLLFVVMAPLGLWFGETNVEKVLLVGSLVLVLLVELLNTAIEAIVDRVSPDYHELSAVAKDIGSAVVMLSLLLVLFTWGMLLL